VTGLPAGKYLVSERLELADPGWIPTAPASVTVDISSGMAATVDFFNVVVGDIWGYKFYDTDMDGKMGLGEDGLGGWKITLIGMTVNGDPVSLSTSTGIDGKFVFAGVQPGKYEISEELPSGWKCTMSLPVTVDVSGGLVTFSIRVDIGNVKNAKIVGYKFLDTYEDAWPYWPNGLWDSDEFGLADWEITLQGKTDGGVPVNRVTHTQNGGKLGYYCFDDVEPGKYWVNETLLMGFYATRPLSNMVIVVSGPEAPGEIRIDFGNLLPSPDPEVPFLLKPGWNLWSCPIIVNGGLTAKSLLETIGSTGLVVVKLDKTTGDHIAYVTGDPDSMDFPIGLGEGIYVWVSDTTAFTLVGIMDDAATTSVEAGWNLVGYTQLKPVKASELLSGADGCTALVIVGMDTETGKYLAYVSGDPAKYDFDITPGRAYYVWCDGSGVLVY
jgi:hypothetical protein